MTTKNNWASATKDALAKTNVSVPTGMKVIGGRNGEEILAFYRFSEPRTPNEKSRVLRKGEVFEGTYDGSFESKMYAGQFTHKIKTAEGLIGLPSCAQLNTYLGRVPKGAQVQVVYNGKNTIESGKYAGKQAHSFQVASDRTVEEAGEGA